MVSKLGSKNEYKSRAKRADNQKPNKSPDTAGISLLSDFKLFDICKSVSWHRTVKGRTALHACWSFILRLFAKERKKNRTQSLSVFAFSR
ncbi:hypothetical protein CEXT_491801 [Caerostris extrusa]|uniref:Uncharacterized protein n=1 Tax=Caerostris extrusa TaxID=172846 RepID=A0AAV4S9Z0_CAEEX|nr:hypothetical protein CEXT_491801 [Caerostris extrusa]